MISDSHEGIISTELFESVKIERERRSNVELSDGIVMRRDTHYSSKKGRGNNGTIYKD